VSGALSVVVLRSLRKLDVNIFVCLFLVFTNYYLYVCYFAAERLKIAILLLLVGVCLTRSVLSRIVFSAAAIMSHVSVILLFSGAALNRMLKILKGGHHRSYWILLEVAAFLISFSLMYAFFIDYILWKVYQYNEDYQFTLRSLVPLILYVSLSLYYSEDKRGVVLDFIPVVIAFAVLGGSRVNMFAYIIFLKHGLQYNRGVSWGVAATSAYFAAKSFFFVRNVLETGQGF
jgi:hypothetical protein